MIAKLSEPTVKTSNERTSVANYESYNVRCRITSENMFQMPTNQNLGPSPHKTLATPLHTPCNGAVSSYIHTIQYDDFSFFFKQLQKSQSCTLAQTGPLLLIPTTFKNIDRKSIQYRTHMNQMHTTPK